MTELRAPDPTLTALGEQDVLVDWTAPHNTYLPVAHLHEHEKVYLFEPMPADIPRWFAVPCRACFPDAPQPGRLPCPTPDAHPHCAGIRDPHLAWQVPLVAPGTGVDHPLALQGAGPMSMDTIMELAAVDAEALHALVTRFVTDSEHHDDRLYIEGWGYSDREVRALVGAWERATEGPEDEARAVVGTHEDEFTDEEGNARHMTVVSVEW